ncbi:Conserved hypothetical protein [Synechococcus sp. RCC307]|nr:Conserved hypothetical protein [Synechococcus sp. RCC307]
MLYSPVSITVYNRFFHFKKCIENLKKNVLADKTTLFIFSDAPRLGDEENVQKVRDYAKNIDGFKDVRLHFQTTNNFAKNGYESRRIPISEFGSVIRMEDDILTAPGFLTFLNHAYQFYQNNPSIVNITGYCPPLRINSDYSKDYFILKRPCAWGWLYDQEILDIVESQIDIGELNSFIKNSRHKITECGEDVLRMAFKDATKQIQAGDVRSMFYQIKYNKYTIYPRYSLVQNIGHDGSGLHCGSTKKFMHDILWDKVDNFDFELLPKPDPEIVRANYQFRSRPLSTAIKIKLKDTIRAWLQS